MLQDVRLAIRSLRATPIVTAVAVLSLVLGIGANTAIFSLVSSLLLRSLPVLDPQRLAMLSTSTSANGRQQYSYATFDQIRGHRELFDGALAYTDCCGVAIFSAGGENEAVARQFVSGDFFTTLGVRAFRGRLLTPPDDVVAAPDGPVAVVSYRLWHQHLGGREDVIGARVPINGVLVTVVGVMPPTFFGVEVGRVLDVAIPYRLAAQFTSTPFDDETPSFVGSQPDMRMASSTDSNCPILTSNVQSLGVGSWLGGRLSPRRVAPDATPRRMS
jgi:putative ABC transport system permease protein